MSKSFVPLVGMISGIRTMQIGIGMRIPQFPAFARTCLIREMMLS